MPIVGLDDENEMFILSLYLLGTVIRQTALPATDETGPSIINYNNKN